MSETPVPAARPETLAGLRDAVHAGLPSAIADLSGLVRIPSVSWDGYDLAHVDASAVAVKALVDDLGRRTGRPRRLRR